MTGSDFWLNGVLIEHRTGYLLIAEGLVCGSPENGFHWTANGAEWVANLLAGAADDRVKAAPTQTVSPSPASKASA